MSGGLPREGTKARQLYELMKGGQWFSALSLAQQVSHRFGGYLHTLKYEYGIDFEKRLDPHRPKGQAWYQYRLVVRGDLFGEE